MLNMGLGFVFSARDLASGAISNLERNFMSLDRRVGLGTERIQSAFRELGLGLAIFTAGMGTLAAGFSLANTAGAFEQSIAAVGAVSGASAEELEQLRSAAIDAGVATQFAPTEATMGLRELAQAGFNAQESMALLLPVLDLAAGSLGELSPQQAAGLASQAMKAFGISTDDASVSVDRMLQAVNVFALNASDLPLALGTASRGAQVLDQSLSETLIALGLVKNVIPSVERASTAVAVSMERMADPEVQQRLRGIGVAVTESGGGFRSFMDILGDLSPELDRMTESQRAAFLLSTFGREALGGVNAILTQVTGGIRTNAGETVRGADAIAYLRDQFENAGGTAAQFRDQMLSTFDGQKQLLKGSMETIAIVAGEPFAQVFRPLVSIVVEVANAVLGVFRELPGPVKKAFAAFVVGAGAVVALVGAAIAAKAGFAILMIGLQAAGVTMGGVVATILPAIAIVGVLALVVAAFVVAFTNNVGGIADFFTRVGERISLAFHGLMQLFDQGGFSGAVRDELNRTENQGLKEFLINVFQIAHRVERFFSAIGAGFGAAIESAGPIFDAFSESLGRIGEALGLIASDAAGAGASIPSDSFATFGEVLGQIAGIVVDVFIGALTLVTDIVGSAFSAFEAAFAPLSPIFDGVRGAFGLVLTELQKLGAALGFAGGGGEGASLAFDALRFVAQALGFVIGNVAAFIAGAIGLMAQFVARRLGLVIASFRSVVSFLSGVIDLVAGLATGNWSLAWDGFKQVVVHAVSFLTRLLLGFVEVLANVIDSVGQVFGKDFGAAEAIRSLQQEIERSLVGGEDESSRPPLNARRALPNMSTMDVANASMPAVASMTPAPVASYQTFSSPAPTSPPVVVHLQVDGETLASVVHQADRDSAGRSFSQVQSY